MSPQPIETADKSGDWIQLWAEGMKPQPFYWSERHGCFVQSEDDNPVRWSAYEDGTCGPTHWAPLLRCRDFETSPSA